MVIFLLLIVTSLDDFSPDPSTPTLIPKDQLYFRTMGQQSRTVAFTDYKALCTLYNCSSYSVSFLDLSKTICYRSIDKPVQVYA